jgi:hypothetical protein
MRLERWKSFALWFGGGCLVAAAIGSISGDYGGAGELVGVGLSLRAGWSERRRRQKLTAERRYRQNHHQEH